MTLTDPAVTIETGPISVLVAEDHEVVREGLIRGLGGRANIADVHVAATVDEAVAAYEQLHPDAVVSDYRLAGHTAVDLIVRLREIDPGVRVLVLSAFVEPQFIVESISAGALGYVSKTTTMTALAETVCKVAKGSLVLEGPTASAVLGQLRSASAPVTMPVAAPALLSARESEVLSAASAGLTNREIADRLGLSDLTVKTHLSRIFSKLGARDRASAVSIAIRSNLI